jgi:hypothetical protein
MLHGTMTITQEATQLRFIPASGLKRGTFSYYWKTEVASCRYRYLVLINGSNCCMILGLEISYVYSAGKPKHTDPNPILSTCFIDTTIIIQEATQLWFIPASGLQCETVSFYWKTEIASHSCYMYLVMRNGSNCCMLRGPERSYVYIAGKPKLTPNYPNPILATFFIGTLRRIIQESCIVDKYTFSMRRVIRSPSTLGSTFVTCDLDSVLGGRDQRLRPKRGGIRL